MNKCFWISAVSFALVACDGTAPDGDVGIVIESPFRDRQVQSVEASTLIAKINVNGGPEQVFYIGPNEPTVFAELEGVRLNENNSLLLKWHEQLNGFEIELAELDYAFLAVGDIVINGALRASRFDYDNDGKSNLQERLDLTCVWSASEICVNDGVADIPRDGEMNDIPPEGRDVFVGSTFAQTGTVVPNRMIDNAIETVIEDDFSNGIDSWVSDVNVINNPDGTLCSVFPPGGVIGFQRGFVSNSGRFRLEPGNYVVQYDVKVTRAAPVSVAFWGTEGMVVLDHWAQGTRSWQTHTIAFDTSAPLTVGLTIVGLRNETETTYCLDNFKLVRI